MKLAVKRELEREEERVTVSECRRERERQASVRGCV